MYQLTGSTFMLGAVGIGALTGALSIASLPSLVRSGRSMLVALFVLGAVPVSWFWRHLGEG